MIRVNRFITDVVDVLHVVDATIWRSVWGNIRHHISLTIDVDVRWKITQQIRTNEERRPYR